MSKGYQHKLTDDDITKIERMAYIGGTMEEISYVMWGVAAPDSLQRRTKVVDALNAALLKGKAEGRLNLKQRAYKKAMDGDTTMLIFLLKTQCGYKEQDGLDVNFTGLVNINHKVRADIDGMNNDELVRYITGIVKDRSLKKERKP